MFIRTVFLAFSYKNCIACEGVGSPLSIIDAKSPTEARNASFLLGFRDHLPHKSNDNSEILYISFSYSINSLLISEAYQKHVFFHNLRCCEI